MPGTSADDLFEFDVVAGTFSPAASPDPDGISEVKFQLDAGGGSDTIELYGLSELSYDFVFSSGGLDLNGDGDVDVTITNAEHLMFRLGTGDDTVDASAGVPSGMTDAHIEDGPGNRKWATSHLMGDGYWLWLINLSSGPISIGVCADPRQHPFESMGDLDSALA